MKLTILGSCSGTEAMPGRHHESVLVEAGGNMYLFDAGDGCAYTAHLLGIDVTRIRAIFISHPHIDHTGGLPYLCFEISKLNWRDGRQEDAPIDVYCPAPEPIAAVRLLTAYGNLSTVNRLALNGVADGVIFADGALTVTAKHNGHMGETKPPWHSFTFQIRAEGRTVVYSGDIKHISELDEWMDCDLMLLETGHHDPVECAKYIAARAKRPDKLVYNHHGRKMLDDPEGCVAAARAELGERVWAAHDGMTIEL